jgi:hypothetical protein
MKAHNIPMWKIVASLGLVGVLAVSGVQAAQITWGATGTFTDDTVLALAGVVSNEVYGVDFGGSGTVTTANGYTFNDYAASGNMSIAGTGFGLYGGYMTGGATTGDSALDTLLTYGLYGSTANTGTLRNLTVGKTYTVLALLDDTRGSAAGGTTFQATDGVGLSPSQPYAFADGSPSAGGYVIGNFTADATTQAFTTENQGAGLNSQYNAILLEIIPAFVPILITNTQPASAAGALGGHADFTAAFSNSPPVTLQWQFISGGVTNPVTAANAGMVTVTNSGVVVSTLTFTNLQLTNAGSYLLEAVNATNSLGVAYSTVAPLVVASLISWVNIGAFTDNTVLALAGSPATEVYGVDFVSEGGDGSGDLTTGNGYTFNDYSDSEGYMSIANVGGTGQGFYGGYLQNGATTGDGTFDTILTCGSYGSINNTGTLNNLTIGQTYTVLVLLDDTRGPGAPNLGQVAGEEAYATEGVSNSPPQDFVFPNGSPAVGGYLLGTFTAAATNQPLSVVSEDSLHNGDPNNPTNWFLNGFYGNSQYNTILVTTGAPVRPAAPALATPNISGGNLILTGAGGTANSGYTILTATNLSAPINWTTGGAGTLDGAGAFSNAMPVSATNPASFFRVQMP